MTGTMKSMEGRIVSDLPIVFTSDELEAYTARVLREAAAAIEDEWPDIYLGSEAATWSRVARWLRARADAEENQ
jgi:hypothetical protein